MKIFEYPYVIITLLILCFLILGAVGIYFALQGIKTAKGTEDNDFSTIKKIENSFYNSGKLRENRCLIYVSVSLDNVRSLYSDAKAWQIFLEIKPILLNIFSDGTNANIALYDQKNFVALNSWSMENAKLNIEKCLAGINKCLLKHEAISIVDIRFGSYCAIATQITFDEAINRAKQACTLAENDDIVYAEWNSINGKALRKKIKIENNIESEIDNNRFFLEYQPVLESKTKRIIGAEVLSRLNSADSGVLTPGSFLDAVDSVGLNDKFDYYIFEKNCKWISNNREKREQYIYTINFSRTTLCDPSFAQKIISIAEKYNLKYSALAIEILEDKNIIGEARTRMISNLSSLKEKGVSILLDDFGRGFTTFDDLQNLDINTVKVDKSITQNSSTETGFLILKNIIRTAKDLGFETLCEGIETKEHESAAIEAGCDMLQGYYYYKPMPVAQFEKILETNSEI